MIRIFFILLVFTGSVCYGDVDKLSGQDITTSTEIAGNASGKIADQTITGPSGNLEYGTATIGGTTSDSPTGRWEPFTVAAGGVTISNGAVYCSSTSSATLQMSIWDNSTPTPVIEGVCSNESSAISSSPGWVAVTWSTPVVLSAGDYWFRYVRVAGTNITYYYDDDASPSRRYGANTTDCTADTFSGTSTRIGTMVIANYASKP
jgi:hypothetical protein